MTDRYPKELSDAQLLAASRRDPEQFGVFYDRHAAAVMRYCIRRTGSTATAADLTAEVFAAAYVKRSTFRDVGAPAVAWLYGIARRQIATFHRRERVADRYRRRLGIDRSRGSEDDLDLVERMVDLDGVRPRIDAALAQLPDGQADAVRLRVVEQRSYAEVADALGCSEGAARVRVSRALTRLAEELEDER